MYTPEPRAGAPTNQVHEVATLRTMKTRIIASCQTALRETDVRITQAETAEEALRRELEDQFIRTLLPSKDVMIPARRLYALLATVNQSYSSLAYAVESALEDRNPGPPGVYEMFFNFQDTFNSMLKDLPDKGVLPYSREFIYLNELLEQWLQLSGTVDTDIARYPVWRHVTELVEDLEPSNPGLWSNRVQPLLRLLQNPDYAPPCGIRTREPRFDHLQLPQFPPHWASDSEGYANPAPRS